MSGRYYCTRQTAGPLVKECRSLRPRLSANDDPWTRREKNAILRSPHSAVCRTQTDRLELRLALFGYEGTMYTLTYDNEHLPPDFPGVRRSLRAFLSRLRRANRNQPFDYVSAIEGKHGDHRYHVHLVLRDSEIDRETVRSLWRQGYVNNEPVLRQTGGFRRLARYLNKERTDGFHIPIGRHPWSCSRSLNRKLPPPTRWKDDSPVIPVPAHTLWNETWSGHNDFGINVYAAWILPQDHNQ